MAKLEIYAKPSSLYRYRPLGIGHYGTGDLELTIQSAADIEKAKPLFDGAYQQG